MILSLAASCLWGQGSVSKPSSALSPKAQNWQISGRVLTIHGKGVAAAEVEISLPGEKHPLRKVKTDDRGSFQVSFLASSGRPGRTEVMLNASCEGYLDAQDTIELESDRAAGTVDLVVQREPEDPHLLSWDDLVAALLPRLRTPVTAALLGGAGLQQFNLGLRLLDQSRPAEAASVFAGLARRNPASIELRTLAGLAGLEAGGWGSATSELSQAAHLAATAQGKARMAEPFVALGVLETWRGEFGKAELSFLQALEIRPDDALALQELGRAFLLQGKIEAGDHYFERALAHGGSADLHLLRAQALVEMGQPEKAQQQMDAYLDGRKPKQLPLGPRSLWVDLTRRIDLELAGGGATLVDRSPADLTGSFQELKGLTPAADQRALESILEKVGENVRSLFEDFPNTSSTEEINMERLHPGAKTASSLDQSFEYLMVNATDENGLRLNEYRTDKDGRPAIPGKADEDFMVTKGFASTPLVFYPDWQDGCNFRLLGRQPLDGHDALVIAFAERPARARMLEEFVSRDRTAVVLVQGLAWVDPGNFRIMRMRTMLLKPEPEIRLDDQTTDVHYAEVRFKAKEQALWLPQEVSVTVHWNGRIYRNRHRYTDYELFQVRTRDQVKAPKPSKATEN
ncbi:MAG TPA: hypothetical protein VI455_15210 [Terriglobia bacterium]